MNQVLKNMGEILKASGANYSSVVKTTIMYVILICFFHGLAYIQSPHNKFIFLQHFKYDHVLLICRLADLKDFKKVNEIYAKCEFLGVKFA